MRDYHIQYGGAAYALPGEPARRLYATGDGDAALLYLYLMCHGGTAEPAQAAIDLRMSAERYDAAVRTLAGVGAIAALEPDPQADKTTQPKPPKKSEPEVYYTAPELARALTADLSFRWLREESEKKLGRTLKEWELRELLKIYDYYKLPPEVILMLLNYVGGEDIRKTGVRFKALSSQAALWAERELYTVEKAEAYIAWETQRKSACMQVARALGITDRALGPTERNYIASWLDAGFTVELIALAYDRNVTSKGTFSWSYTNGILNRWKQKGYRTPEDVERGDRRPPRGESSVRRQDDDAYYERLRQAYLEEKGRRQK
ncbi:MAG: DnaD domain protein [Clostridiales bacterium]|jgi:DnaD/phage-associated family protein|nr:DnaD domain protein [Clostridiales bacterium]